MLSTQRRATAVAASLAMLSACNASRTEEPASTPDPIVTIKRETTLVCPAELLMPLPAAPTPLPGAVIEGNEAGLAFVGALGSFAQALVDRLRDASEQCQ